MGKGEPGDFVEILRDLRELRGVGQGQELDGPALMAPRSSRWPVVTLLILSSSSRIRCAWALAREKPASLASAPRSAAWL